jgi:Subtilase family
VCEDAAFTTIAGTRDRVQWMMQRWEEMRLITDETLWERGIRLEWYDLADGLGDTYREPQCGAVAVAFHDGRDAASTAASVTSALLLANHGEPTGLLCEPGHTFAGDAQAVSPGPAPLDPNQLRRAHTHLPSVTKRSGSRAALLDTGDVASNTSDIVDLTSGRLNTNVTTADPHGHGSAVAEAIRFVCPHADLKPIQVLGAGGTGTSFAIYQGLVAALWDGQGCDVVNASLGVDATKKCGTSLGATFNYLMTLRHSQKSQYRYPALVVAAGNDRTSLRAPATADGANVVKAIDFNGNVAPYCSNLTVPAGVVMHSAPGGVKGDPLGHYASGAEVYGTSFAAGFVSGALLT